MTAPFTERMNELIAWAEERAAVCDGWDSDFQAGCAETFREVANHLRQLSQGAKTDEG